MRCPKRLERRQDFRGLAAETLERRQCLSATVSVTLAEPVVIEGEAHVATIRLSRALAQVERVFVSTADRTASFGRDYFQMVSEQVVFMPGETTKTVSIRTLRDAATERVEAFDVRATPVNPALRAGMTQARITDYVAPPLVSVSSVTVNEGSSGTTPAIFTLTLSTNYPKEVSVSYATRDGSATVADTDYQAASGRVTFAPGETTKTVTVNVFGDRTAEADESFRLMLTATNATLRQTSVTGTIRNDELSQSGYQITLDFAGDVPQAVRSLAAEAAARWSRVIVGDLPSVTDADGFVDDMVFRVQMGLLGGAANGPGDTLANAGPLNFRDGGTGLPYSAIMGIDPSDANTNTPSARADLLSVLIHEMGHGLGFPGSAAFRSLVRGSFFTGANAVREYRSIFGNLADPAGVPLETGGGQGTAGGHWDDNVFGTELMTGYLDAGVTNSLSRVTVGALQDIGYTVSYSAADTYRPPQSPGSPVTGSRPIVQRPATSWPMPTPSGSRPVVLNTGLRTTTTEAATTPANPTGHSKTIPEGLGLLPWSTAMAALGDISATNMATPTPKGLAAGRPSVFGLAR